MAATLIEHTFNDNTTLVVVETCFSDNLLDHVKGGVFWNLAERCYCLAIGGEIGPVKIINDVWFTLQRNSNGRYGTCPNNTILLGEGRDVGWWRADDA
jgi:hypothetical protein